MNQRLIAIWKYDLPPFYLAGEIESIEGDFVTVKGYGKMMFKPVKIFSYDAGIIVKERLEALGKQYREEHSNLLGEVNKAALSA